MLELLEQLRRRIRDLEHLPVFGTQEPLLLGVGQESVERGVFVGNGVGVGSAGMYDGSAVNVGRGSPNDGSGAGVLVGTAPTGP